ncbi:potassium-transporting ATPase subunit KdpC [Phenylobacterium sp.]|uniref:potassium-transporting ATPase subunit KdpC n=1 Tax=Phenylobacterium sp. TaxID=1871053 RepID=UPI002730C2ED|nr:potassium-transporting ATPase subunit KdpC [Phenylobacterium sp.]MDP1616017.1 potassium-transporting ATPase subunit KdpC [Phenylobacterium sp.]MDP1986895.1 potassium-transporting ATPase subunit KdpC [Phenylobacterium sp.]
MLSLLRPALVSVGLFTVLLGLAYPLAITGAAQAAFPQQADGSLIIRDGRVVGSSLVGQAFTSARYLQGRPSAVDYDATGSGASNLGPLNAELIAETSERAAAWRAANDSRDVPGDAVTASASGLDPHVSPANALAQSGRIAAARGVDIAQVQAVIADHVEGRTFGLLGQPRVNVLETNLALDEAFAPEQPDRP